jgi:hypothetical protein
LASNHSLTLGAGGAALDDSASVSFSVAEPVTPKSYFIFILRCLIPPSYPDSSGWLSLLAIKPMAMPTLNANCRVVFKKIRAKVKALFVMMG